MRNAERSKLLVEVIPRVMHLIRAEMRAAGEGELTVPQFRILNRLSRSTSSSGSSNQELASWLGVSAPSMSKMVDILVNRGLVLRREGEADRRQNVIECSAAGRKMVDEIRSTVHGRFTEAISALPKDKLQVLEDGLLVLLDLQEAFP